MLVLLYMNTLNIINILIIVLSISTSVLILLNQPNTDSTFGSKDSFSRTRRGFEKTLHSTTVLSSVLLVLSVLALQLFK